MRWTLAGALIYYYNTSSVFAEETPFAVHAPPEIPVQSESPLSLEALIKQREARAQAEADQLVAATKQKATTVTEATVSTEQVPEQDEAAPGSPEELEEEASQQGAFNEETGEINWDCPCLGGMAHGPCGEQFRDAFSCFVYSKEEPKGVDCIDKFKNMQNCFREHPDIYGAELDDEETEAALESEKSGSESHNASGVEATSSSPTHGEKVADGPAHPAEAQGKRERSKAAGEQVKAQHGEPTSESNEAVPKAWHDEK